MDIEKLKNSFKEQNEDLVKVSNFRNYNLADFKYEKIQEQIKDFQDCISDNLDVCVKFTSYGDKYIYVEDIGYQNPDLIYFYGYLDDNKVQIIQHVSQLNFMLIALPKSKPTEKPKRIIGFITNEA